MKAMNLIIAASILLTAPAFGQATDPSALCAEKFMPGTANYSDCLNGKPSPSVQASAVVDFRRSMGSWGIQTFDDKIDGKSAIAQLGSDSADYFPQRRASEQKFARLVIHCNAKEFALYYSIRNTLIASHRTVVTYKIDGAVPVTSHAWQASTSSDSIGFWNYRSAKPFIDRIAKAKRIVLRTEHNVFGRSGAEFSPEGISIAVTEIRKVCGLKN